MRAGHNDTARGGGAIANSVSRVKFEKKKGEPVSEPVELRWDVKVGDRVSQTA